MGQLRELMGCCLRQLGFPEIIRFRGIDIREVFYECSIRHCSTQSCCVQITVASLDLLKHERNAPAVINSMMGCPNKGGI